MSLFAIWGPGLYIYSKASPGSIFHEARIFNLTEAIFIRGTVFSFLAAVVALPPWHWVFKPAKEYIFGMVTFGFASGVYSSYSARKFFLAGGRNYIFKVQMAFSVAQFLFSAIAIGTFAFGK